VAILIAVLCTPLAHAQKSRETQKSNRTKPSGSESSLEAAARRRLIVGRLESVGERARTLDNTILKVRALAKVADALWAENSSRARILFRTAFESIENIELTAAQDQRVALAQARNGRFGPLFHLRSHVLQLIARHDQAFAKELLDAYISNKENANKPDNLSKEELAQISADVAIASARTQPERSTQLVRSLMTTKIDYSLAFLLMRIRGENPSLADSLFKEALAVAGQHGLAPAELDSLSVYVLPTEDDVFYGNDPLADAGRHAVASAFLDYVYAGSMQLGSAATFTSSSGEIDQQLAKRVYNALTRVAPLFARLQPQRAAVVNEQMRRLLGYMESDDALRVDKPARKSVDELLHDAESAVGDRRRTLGFMRASSAALADGDVDRAVAIAERIDDQYERKIQTSLVRYQTSMKLLREDKVDKAYEYAKLVEFLPQRVLLFDRLAQKFRKDKNPNRARETLEEIWAWLLKASNGPQKVDAMLTITLTMAQQDVERAFDFVQATVKTLNSTDFSFTPPDPNRISVELAISPDMLPLEPVFIALAKSDLERAYGVAETLTSPPLSLLAQATVFEQVLTPRRN